MIWHLSLYQISMNRFADIGFVYIGLQKNCLQQIYLESYVFTKLLVESAYIAQLTIQIHLISISDKMLGQLVGLKSCGDRRAISPPDCCKHFTQ